jgi:signal transduction histidine kinase
LEAEEGKLLRILENLVGNAIEAVTDGCKIEIRGTSRDDLVDITISDNAGGIPVEIRDKFFEPFVTHGKKRGTGLGTAIVKSLVEAHGGEIAFECEDGVGTVFTITLPKSQASRYSGAQI